ncbi:major facilitator superfamily domain-containing protein [Lentinula raphanica]|uniref:Major facilitator superfamily domain-containing protein n=1 Tax=Lentinula raphanica TaxID=153919 RepID=A0AA38PC03_9AGAR|nr:major facilitator superfamily domain-containing protein [Lentinula raphanica]KAJ3762279.1 major facilitator superfamily domain-containing protein [Lentinula raphanica]KAJ3772278.1 major facilitator superfamily domain-containing protein [Lentinula raphanica]KAJ3817998.1 major facilitator superfamily domain-containing protein [Lentinula raphanica]KAJ3839951.1 major facilitator superfamily domain-containing protein [Lentinula raphanica]
MSEQRRSFEKAQQAEAGHYTTDPSSDGSEKGVKVTPPASHPVGATKAWLTVLGCFCIQFCTVASVNSFGVFEDYYVSEFLPSSSASRVSWIIGLEILLQLGLGVIGGKLCDLGHTRVVFATGSIIYLVSFFMLSLTKEDQYYQVILAQGVGMGIGVGLCYVPALVTAALHFPGRQAIAMGIVISAGSFGGGIFSIMINQLIPKHGFPSAIRATAYLSLGLLAIGNLLVTVPPRPPKAVAGDTPLLYTPYLLTLFSGFLGQLGGLFPLFYIQLFADSHHMAEGFIFYSVAAMSFSTAFGRVVPSYFADKYGVVGTYIVCAIINAGCAFIMFGASHPAGLIVFCILYGFFFGSATSLFSPVITALMPSEADRGKLVGVAMAPVAISSLIGSPVGGAIIGSGLDWWKGIVWTGVLMGTSAAIQVVARILHRKNLKLRAATA